MKLTLPQIGQIWHNAYGETRKIHSHEGTPCWMTDFHKYIRFFHGKDLDGNKCLTFVELAKRGWKL